jgi:hypothetical protein
VGVRDRWIGWEASCRESHLGRVLNNARFLILPWIQVKNLESTPKSPPGHRVRSGRLVK